MNIVKTGIVIVLATGISACSTKSLDDGEIKKNDPFYSSRPSESCTRKIEELENRLAQCQRYIRMHDNK